MQLVKDIKGAMKLKGFRHISSSTLIKVRDYPAVIVEAQEPVSDIDEASVLVLTEMKFTCYVFVAFDGNVTEEDAYDKKMDELEAKVADAKSALQQFGFALKYSNELIDPLRIDSRDVLAWMFDAQMIFS